MSLLLVASYSNTMKSIFIKKPETKYIMRNHELIESASPVVILLESDAQFEMMKFSPYYLDNWLYDNVKEYLLWSRWEAQHTIGHFIFHIIDEKV